jgi:hypothetical protein
MRQSGLTITGEFAFAFRFARCEHSFVASKKSILLTKLSTLFGGPRSNRQMKKLRPRGGSVAASDEGSRLDKG